MSASPPEMIMSLFAFLIKIGQFEKIVSKWRSFDAIEKDVFGQEIVLAADEWCSYNCSPGSDKPGFMVEVAKRIFESQGHKVGYITINWARAIVETRQGRFNGIIGAFKEDAPDFIFPENEQAYGNNQFFVKKGDHWRYDGLQSLKNNKIGIIVGYSYGDEMDKFLMANLHKNVEAVPGNNALALNIGKLLNDRIDTFIEDQNVFAMTAKEMGRFYQIVSAGDYSGGSNKIYIAFSPALPPSNHYAKLLSDGITRIRATGELKIILDKYGLTDWK